MGCGRGLAAATKNILIFHNINIKTKLIITLTISYQFQTLIQRIDTEFYCGSRGMVFIYV